MFNFKKCACLFIGIWEITFLIEMTLPAVSGSHCLKVDALKDHLTPYLAVGGGKSAAMSTWWVLGWDAAQWCAMRTKRLQWWSTRLESLINHEDFFTVHWVCPIWTVNKVQTLEHVLILFSDLITRFLKMLETLLGKCAIKSCFL